MQGSFFRAIPEWERSSLFIVWPATIRDDLTPVYLKLITTFSHLLPLTVLIRRSAYSDVVFPSDVASIRLLPIDDIADIWIQDWAPIAMRTDQGNPLLAKATYRPAYLEAECEFVSIDNVAGRMLGKALNLPLIDLPLVMDGGVMIHNGEGIAVTTTRLLTDNAHLTEEQVRHTLLQYLGIEQLIVVPEEPHDVTGHIDGIARFISPRKIIVGAYPETYDEGHTFMNSVASQLSATLDPSFNIYRIENLHPENSVSEGVASAFGNYLNFLQVGNVMILPSYGLNQETELLNQIQREFPDFQLVMSADVTEISRLGGSIHCISWQF